jgi:hypothetical protein
MESAGYTRQNISYSVLYDVYRETNSAKLISLLNKQTLLPQRPHGKAVYFSNNGITKKKYYLLESDVVWPDVSLSEFQNSILRQSSGPKNKPSK